MSTEEHLKMFHCLVDTGADVLRNLAEIRLLDNKKKTFYQFLEDEKHYFYHQFEQKVLCCECPPYGCTVSRGKMEAHLFNKVYEFKKERINKSHIVKNGMKNQKCLHAIHTRNVILDNLDLSDLNYFLWTKGKLIPQENTAIKIIMDTRNIICHPSSTTCIGLHEINNMWTELENAVLDLSQPERYKNMVKMCIGSHRARHEMETEKILHGMNQIKETVKDELIKARSYLTDESKEQTRMLRQLIGCFENFSVFAQASPQVALDECQASGGSGQINMTATLELSSLSKEEQRQIVEKFPSDLKVGSEDKNITIDGKQVNSIVLGLTVSPSIFRDTETLRSALMALAWEVVDIGKIDTTVRDAIYVTLTFNSPLSSHETEVLTGVLTPKMLDITDGESEGRIHDDTFGVSKDDKQGATYSCNSCQQKDIQILELKKNNRKLKENIWKLHRFLNSNDPKTVEETACEDSDYMSIQSISAESWEDASIIGSDYMPHQPSVIIEKLEDIQFQTERTNAIETIKTHLEKIEDLHLETEKTTDMEMINKPLEKIKEDIHLQMTTAINMIKKQLENIHLEFKSTPDMESLTPDVVLWQLQVPDKWNLNDMEEVMKRFKSENQLLNKINVKFVRKG